MLQEIRKRKQNEIDGYVTMDGEGKCGGRKQHSELNPEIVKYEEGFTNQNGNKFNPKSIRNMVKQ